MHRYYAFELTILSELCLPELLICAKQPPREVDVIITYGEVSSEGIDNPLSQGHSFQANRQMLWLRVPHVARFLVENGRTIIIDPMPGIDEASLRVFLLGSCFGALLMQRGLFLLHGNAIRVGEYAVSFTGQSGAGKSTLSGAFLRRGYSVLADDICAINAEGEVLPSFPQIKLWADAAKQLAVQTHSLRKIRSHLEKFALPIGEQFCTKPLPLSTVYVLRPYNQEKLSLTGFSGMAKLQPLKSQIYRRQYLKGLERDAVTFMRCGQLARTVSVSRIQRPNAGYALDALVDLIENDFAKRSIEHVCA